MAKCAGNPAIRIAIIDGPVDLHHLAQSGTRHALGDQGSNAVSKSAV
jgi:hypothetical protein